MGKATLVEDRKLVQDFLNNRSETAFLSLYRAKTPHLYQMALRLTQDEYQSEELIQETWMIAVGKLSTFQWKSELKTWLIGILINLYRSTRKSKEKEITSSALELSNAVSVAQTWSESAADLEKAISLLPPGYRQIILLHDVEGYKHREIAEILDISQGTSKSQLFHARKTLRKYLNEETLKKEGNE